MKARIFGAAVLVAVLAIAASTASGATKHRAAGSITVWLQVDAQTSWPDVVAAANAAFQKQHPGINVNVQYQTWGTHLQKFDAALGGGNTPDVIELGNTEMTKYMAAGAFQDLSSSKASFDNSSTWLAGLAASGRYNGKLYGVPYYAGSRVVTYRTDLFRQAGMKSAPTSLAQFTAAAKAVDKKFGKQGFSPVYIAGTDWYFAMSFVYDYGGKIATQVSGKWKGVLDSKQAIAGLTAYKNFFNAASHASKTADEARPLPYSVYAEGLAASMIGPGWFSGSVGAKYKGSTAQFVMPSHEAGKVMPGFQGGSDLAVPVGANKALAVDWIAAFTSTSAEKGLQAKGNIPNTTTLLNTAKVNERAALRSWVVPTAKNWVNVENGNILRTMLAQI
jgi:N,N'-diacetylchitobiose transport system substrate-binding protein